MVILDGGRLTKHHESGKLASAYGLYQCIRFTYPIAYEVSVAGTTVWIVAYPAYT